jgi:hypothetical protein
MYFWRVGLRKVERNQAQYPDENYAKTGGKPEQDRREEQHDEVSAATAFGVARRTGTSAKIVPYGAISDRLPWHRRAQKRTALLQRRLCESVTSNG